MKNMDVIVARSLSFGLISNEGMYTIDPVKTITYRDENDTATELRTLYPVRYVAYDDKKLKFSKDTFGDKKLTVLSGKTGEPVVFSIYRNYVFVAQNIEELTKAVATAEAVGLK